MAMPRVAEFFSPFVWYPRGFSYQGNRQEQDLGGGEQCPFLVKSLEENGLSTGEFSGTTVLEKIPMELKSYILASLELFMPTLPTHLTPTVKMAAWRADSLGRKKTNDEQDTAQCE